MYVTPALLAITLPLFVDAVGRELKQSIHISSNAGNGSSFKDGKYIYMDVMTGQYLHNKLTKALLRIHLS
jgi:hypothetical protein